MLVLHKTGNIAGDAKVSRVWLAADWTKVSITPDGRKALKDRDQKLDIALKMTRKR